MISPIRLTCAVALGALLAISDVGRAAPDDDLHSLAQFRGVYRAGAEHATTVRRRF
jgi:hypothetical protein